jgi:hypothetical protein
MSHASCIANQKYVVATQFLCQSTYRDSSASSIYYLMVNYLCLVVDALQNHSGLLQVLSQTAD